MSDTEKALDGLEVGRRRVARERKVAEAALANLNERLGVEDEDVVALDRVFTAWHSTLVRHADMLSELLRRLIDYEADQDAKGEPR
jgi:hypothetical protein